MYLVLLKVQQKTESHQLSLMFFNGNCPYCCKQQQWPYKQYTKSAHLKNLFLSFMSHVSARVHSLFFWSSTHKTDSHSTQSTEKENTQQFNSIVSTVSNWSSLQSKLRYGWILVEYILEVTRQYVQLGGQKGKRQKPTVTLSRPLPPNIYILGPSPRLFGTGQPASNINWGEGEGHKGARSRLFHSFSKGRRRGSKP